MDFTSSPFIRFGFRALLLSLLSSCATFKKLHFTHRGEPTPTVTASSGPQRCGTITLVNEVEHFVLIDAGMAAVPPIGTALKSFTGETASGVVTVGNVNRRPFVVADIVQGAPKKGDGVFQ